MQIEFEGRLWEYDEDGITVQHAIAMHQAYGFTIRDWQLAIAELDPRGFACCYWLMLAQNGAARPLKDIDFKVIEFITAYREAATADGPEAAAEPDPTPPPPHGPKGARTASKAPASPTGTTPPPISLPPPEASTAS